MTATTPNLGLPYPEDTDLVRDGAAAIQALAEAVDDVALIGPVETVNDVAGAGTTETIPDVGTATMHRLVLTANCTLTFPTPTAGKSFTLILVQDGTGGRTVTWPGSVIWGDAGAPTLSTGANKGDVFTFFCDSTTAGLWIGLFAGKGF